MDTIENLSAVVDPVQENFPCILQSESLSKYILETAVYPREPQLLKELRETSKNHLGHLSNIATDPDVAQLIALLLKLLNAKKTIELGVFTGYSLLLTALNISNDGKFNKHAWTHSLLLQITAIDINRKVYEIGLPFIKKAGVEHKIDFMESPALPILDKLLQDPANLGTYDFAFVDADKNNYVNYHERLIKLVKVGGLLIYDDTLLGGFVAWPEEQVSEIQKPYRQAAIELNNAVVKDSRVEIALTSVGNGLTICRRIA